MKKEKLQHGIKCKVSETIPSAEGALYKGDVVTLLEWTQVGKSDETIILYVEDDVSKHHTVSLSQLEVL